MLIRILINFSHERGTGMHTKSKANLEATSFPERTKYLSTHAKYSKDEQVDVENLNFQSLSYKQTQNLPTDCDVTSLTSSKIGSMKSSLVSVVAGSQMIANFANENIESLSKHESNTHTIPNKDKNKISSGTEKGIETKEVRVKATFNAVPTSITDTILTDAEDADTSGVFSISESTPNKKPNATSHLSIENISNTPSTLLEHAGGNKAFHITNTLQNNPERDKRKHVSNDSMYNIKEDIAFHNTNDPSNTPQDKATLQKLSRIQETGKENIENEVQKRRKGTI